MAYEFYESEVEHSISIEMREATIADLEVDLRCARRDGLLDYATKVEGMLAHERALLALQRIAEEAEACLVRRPNTGEYRNSMTTIVSFANEVLL